MRINNYVRRIGEGTDSPAVLAALHTAEAKKRLLIQPRADADKAISAATVVWPAAVQVQQNWGVVVELWPDLDEPGRRAVLGGRMERMELQDKQDILVDMALYFKANPQGYYADVVLSGYYGADLRLNATPPTFNPDTLPPNSASV